MIMELAKNGTYEQRDGAIDALGHIANKRAVPLLLEMKEQGDIGFRVGIIGSLGRIGDEKSLKYLKLAQKDKNCEIRDAAERAIGEWGKRTNLF